MIFNSTKLLLANTMMIGVIMTVCSNNWLSMWMGLELTLLSFIPFIQNKIISSSESMMKYFIIQSIASTMFIFSVICMLIGVSIANEMILTISMLIKIGSAPFHNWIILMIENMNYLTIFSFLTLLKIPPLVIIFQINTKYFILPSILSMIISSISCVNQSSMRKTIAYSSIFNMGIIIMTIDKMSITISFMLLYSMTMSMLLILMEIMKINFINQMISNEFSSWIKINLWFNMLSMSGFPPMIGFTMKIMAIQNMIMNSQFLVIFTLLLTSSLMTMFYMRIAFTSMLNFHLQKKWNTNLTYPVHYFMMLNLMLNPLMMTLTSVY